MMHLAFIRAAADKSVAALKKDFHRQFKLRRRDVARRQQQQCSQSSSRQPFSSQQQQQQSSQRDEGQSDVWDEDYEDEDYHNERDRERDGERESSEEIDLRGFSFAFTANNNNNNNTTTTTVSSSSSSSLSQCILDLREEEGFANGKKRHFRRVFVRCADSGPYQEVGWVLSGDADACMACTKPFTGVLFAKKHHCRACGNVICDACSLEETVDLLEALGPQRVCRMCFFDQSPVQAVRHRDVGVSLLLNAHENEALVLQEEQQETSGKRRSNPQPETRSEEEEEEEVEEEMMQLTYWHFGEVSLQSLKPGFVLKAYEQQRVLFINVCGCDSVPQNTNTAAQQTNERGLSVFPMVVGERGVATNGCVVRDVALSEYLLAKARFDSTIKGEIAAQVLAGVVRVTGEKPLRNYSFVQQTYLARNTPAQESPVLAIPAQSVFAFLTQVGTRLSDAQRPLALPPQEDMDLVRESLAEATPEELKRVRAILFPPESESATVAMANTVNSPAVMSPKVIRDEQVRPLPSAPKNHSSVFTFDEAKIESKSNKNAGANNNNNNNYVDNNSNSSRNNFGKPPLSQQRSPNVSPVDITQDTRSARERVPLLALPSRLQTRSRAQNTGAGTGRPPLDASVSMSSSSFRPQSVPVTATHAQQLVTAKVAPRPLTSPPLTLRRRTETTIKQLALLPRPGFVIKTFANSSGTPAGEMFSDENRKIFVNVFQHEVADKLQAAIALSRGEDIIDGDIFVLFSEKSSVEDKNGLRTPLYNVCVGASHFNSSNNDSLDIVSRESVAQILRKVNGQFHDDLDTHNFVLPRVKGGFKGELPAAPLVFRYLAPLDTLPLTARSSYSLVSSPQREGDGGASLTGSVSIDRRMFYKGVVGRGESFSRMSSRQLPPGPPAMESPRSQLTDSPVSSLSSTAGPGGEKKKNRKSFFPFTLSGSPEEDLRVGERMVRNETLSLSQLIRSVKPLTRVEEETIRRKSLENAEWLVGYHITVYENSGVKANYITTGSRRATFGKTEFRLSAPGKDDRWVHLKRAEYKSGLPFKINHKVKLAIASENDQVSPKN